MQEALKNSVATHNHDTFFKVRMSNTKELKIMPVQNKLWLVRLFKSVMYFFSCLYIILLYIDLDAPQCQKLQKYFIFKIVLRRYFINH